MASLVLNEPDVLYSNHEPYWISSITKDNYSILNKNIKVDVAIIGGGMVGITTAFLLKRKGLKVAVLEADQILHGTTGHTTAKITSQHNLIYDKISKKIGRDYAKQYADANESAIRFIENLVKEKNIDCDFSLLPAYVYTQTDEFIQKIQAETKTAIDLGINAAYLEEIPLPYKIKAGIRFDNQAQFHPLKYLLALAKDIPGDGCDIYEHSKVVDVDDKEYCTMTTWNGCKVTSSKIIVASHFPCYDGLGMYFARIYQEKSYVIGVKIGDEFPQGMFITAEDPGRSLRSQKYDNDEMIIIGGEHHKTGSHEKTNVHYENLAKYAKDNFNLKEIICRWSTQDCMTADGVPYTGYLNSRTKNVLVATGFGKWGMTNSTASAMILTDLITKGESEWGDVYNPSRTDLTASAPNLISQNFDVAVKLVSGKIAVPPSDFEIKRGEAKIVSVKGERVGAYRDEQGELHVIDITCTHLGCELVWNEAEKTWDCPCHGSRFSYRGDNVEGPAFNPLHPQGAGPNIKDPNLS